MATLPNFPIKNQRITTLSDGSPDPNADYDCVPESIAACLQYFNGGDVVGGQLKEAVYGAAYTGGQAASAYVQYCASKGCTLMSVNGDYTSLIAATHTFIQHGLPVIMTEIDPYSSLAGSTHVCVFYAEAVGSLTIMDPFIASSITKTDAEWAALMQFNQIWIMSKIQENTTVSISPKTSGVGTYFSQAPGNAWRCSNGNLIGNAMLTFYQTVGNAGLCGLTILGLPTGNEVHPEGTPAGVTEQTFERGTLRYDPKHQIDNPPGAGPVYLCHIVPASVASSADLNTALAKVTDLTNKLKAISTIVGA
jgi:hypothetical protein